MCIDESLYTKYRHPPGPCGIKIIHVLIIHNLLFQGTFFNNIYPWKQISWITGTIHALQECVMFVYSIKYHIKYREKNARALTCVVGTWYSAMLDTVGTRYPAILDILVLVRCTHHNSLKDIIKSIVSRYSKKRYNFDLGNQI